MLFMHFKICCLEDKVMNGQLIVLSKHNQYKEMKVGWKNNIQIRQTNG